MHNLNPSSASMRADSDPFDSQGHCHSNILFLYPLPYSHYMTFQSSSGAKFMKQAVLAVRSNS